MLTEAEKQSYFELLSSWFVELSPDECVDVESKDGIVSVADYYEDMALKIGASRVAWGASKIVFWYYNIPNYVVKIPMFGWYDYEGEYCEFLNAYINTPNCEEYGVKLQSGVAFNDYCRIEAALTGLLETNYPRLEQFFAKTFYIGTTENGIPIYLSEKINDTLANACIEDYPSKRAYKTASNYIDSHGHVGGLSTTTIGRLYEKHEKDLVDELLDFIGLYVNDLHDDNIGVTENENLVFIDYSDFCS